MDFYFAAFLDPSTIGLRVKNIGGTRLSDEPKTWNRLTEIVIRTKFHRRRPLTFWRPRSARVMRMFPGGTMGSVKKKGRQKGAAQTAPSSIDKRTPRSPSGP